MPKRKPPPPPPDDEKYFAIWNPFPRLANMELPGDHQSFARWFACVLGDPVPFHAIFHKPTVRNALAFSRWFVIEISRSPLYLRISTVAVCLRYTEPWYRDCGSRQEFWGCVRQNRMEKNSWRAQVGRGLEEPGPEGERSRHSHFFCALQECSRSRKDR